MEITHRCGTKVNVRLGGLSPRCPECDQLIVGYTRTCDGCGGKFDAVVPMSKTECPLCGLATHVAECAVCGQHGWTHDGTTTWTCDACGTPKPPLNAGLLGSAPLATTNVAPPHTPEVPLVRPEPLAPSASVTPTVLRGPTVVPPATRSVTATALVPPTTRELPAATLAEQRKPVTTGQWVLIAVAVVAAGYAAYYAWPILVVASVMYAIVRKRDSGSAIVWGLLAILLVAGVGGEGAWGLFLYNHATKGGATAQAQDPLAVPDYCQFSGPAFDAIRCRNYENNLPDPTTTTTGPPPPASPNVVLDAPIPSLVTLAVVPANATLATDVPNTNDNATYNMPAGASVIQLRTWYETQMPPGHKFRNLTWSNEDLRQTNIIGDQWFWCNGTGYDLSLTFAPDGSSAPFVQIRSEQDTSGDCG